MTSKAIDPIRVLIVDDEEDARYMIRTFLQAFPEFEVAGESDAADKALYDISLMQPELVFLDIQMPGKTGFELITALHQLNLRPAIIFITAHNQYVLKAIKEAAFDYLLKPLNKKEFSETLSRYLANRQQRLTETRLEQLLKNLQPPQKLRLNARKGYVMIHPHEIIYCQADWSYTELWLSKEKKEVVSMNIGKLEELLPETQFTRISRSILVNRAYIEKLDRKTRLVTLRKGEEVFTFKVVASKVGSV